jgi:hypothetical protein
VQAFTRGEIAGMAEGRLVRGRHIVQAIDDHERGQVFPLSMIQVTEASPFPEEDGGHG